MSLHVEITADALLKMVTASLGIVDNKANIPELSHVLLTAVTEPDGGKLKCEAYDMEVSLSSVQACTVVDRGRVLVSAKLLRQLAQKLDGVVTLEESGARLDVKYDGGSYRLPTLSAEHFPAMPSTDGFEWKSCSAAHFFTGLSKVRHAICVDEARLNMQGIRIEKADEQTRFCATDGSRLAVYWVPFDRMPVDAACTVPTKAVNALRQLTDPLGDGPVDIAINDRAIACRSLGWTFVSRLIDGTYPEVMHAVPTEGDRVANLSHNSLLASVDRMTPVLGEHNKLAVEFSERRLAISTEDRDGRRAETSIATDGQFEMRIGFNARYLLDALTSVDSELVRVSAWDELAPITIRPANSADELYVVMPMRL